MKIKVAKTTGLCSGVKRAIKIAEECIKINKKDIYPVPEKSRYRVYSWGPIIHNPQIIQQLSKSGLRVIKDLKEVSRDSILILPSHGANPNLIKRLKNKLNLVDVSCPYVRHLQEICRKLKKDNYQIIIVGDKNHTEIKVLLNIAPEAIVIDRIPMVKDNLLTSKRIGIISQTTQDKELYLKIIKKILESNRHLAEIKIFNTICSESQKRQEAVKDLSQRVKLMLIVGGKNSANTRRLAQISRRSRIKTIHFEDPEELDLKLISKQKIIGIAGGCSTPDWLIRKTLRKIKRGEN